MIKMKMPTGSMIFIRMFLPGLIMLLLLASYVTANQMQMLTVYGSTTCIRSFLEPGASEFERDTGIQLRTVGVGTGQGLFALIQGMTEVSAASETLEQAIESARKYAASKGMSVLKVPADLQFHKIVDDEVVVIVHKDNPIKALTWKQLKDLNTGKIKNWSELGGPNMPVKVVTSHVGSATRLFFQKTVMDNAPYTSDAVTVWPTAKEIEEVSRDRGAIGAVSMAFYKQANMDTKAIYTDKIVRPLGLITRGEPSDKVKRLILFFTAGAGKKYIGATESK